MYQVAQKRESQRKKDSYFLEIAHLVASRATCIRRKVGCVLVDSKQHIVATGYNGVPANFPHCTENPCEGAKYAPGTGLNLCEAIHAEVNAILQLRSDDNLTAYLTVMPCYTCSKMLANSNIKRIVASEEYVHTKSVKILEESGINVEIISE